MIYKETDIIAKNDPHIIIESIKSYFKKKNVCIKEIEKNYKIYTKYHSDDCDVEFILWLENICEDMNCIRTKKIKGNIFYFSIVFLQIQNHLNEAGLVC